MGVLTPWMHLHAAGFIAFDAAHILFLEEHRGSGRSSMPTAFGAGSFEMFELTFVPYIQIEQKSWQVEKCLPLRGSEKLSIT
jgi:hypothetical protein